MRIYLAHPISGLTYDEVWDYYNKTSETLSDAGFYVLMPMTGKGELRPEKEYKANTPSTNPVAGNHAIIERDNWMVHMADVVYVDLTGAVGVSIGCMMELAWAHELRKHTVVVLDEAGWHKHAFVLEAADIVFNTSEGAIEYLRKLPTQLP